MKKILLVEDDALLNKTLTYNLISEGYDTVSVLNAGTAAEVLARTEFGCDRYGKRHPGEQAVDRRSLCFFPADHRTANFLPLRTFL